MERKNGKLDLQRRFASSKRITKRMIDVLVTVNGNIHHKRLIALEIERTP